MSTKRQREILLELERLYPEARAELDFGDPYELLMATILSAQCTDVRVNQVTPALFRDYPDIAAMAAAEPGDIEPYIHSCGFFNAKSRNMVNACRILMRDYGGRVPNDMAELMKLPGVGRKTANVVLSNAYGTPGIAVDTHVFRVSNRLGLAHADDVYHTELQLQKVIPKAEWSRAHHLLIFHGRRVCASRKPKCDICTLTPWCEYYKREVAGKQPPPKREKPGKAPG